MDRDVLGLTYLLSGHPSGGVVCVPTRRLRLGLRRAAGAVRMAASGQPQPVNRDADDARRRAVSARVELVALDLALATELATELRSRLVFPRGWVRCRRRVFTAFVHRWTVLG